MCDRPLTMDELCLEAVRQRGSDIKAGRTYVNGSKACRTREIAAEGRDRPRPGVPAAVARNRFAALGLARAVVA
jgi:hypothetical protein